MQDIKTLVWDSGFFGYTIGRIDINDCVFEPIPDSVNEFDLIYLFSAVKQQLEDIIVPIDVKVNYIKHISQTSTMPPNIEEYKGELNEELVNLAILSGRYSRFKKDPFLGIRFEMLYTLWIQKSISGILADKVLIYKKDDDILGFITLKLVPGYVQVGLIAVHDHHMGKGIGSSLLQAISAVYPNKKIIVSTQQENKEANALYKKNGFLIGTKQYIYHLWK